LDIDTGVPETPLQQVFYHTAESMHGSVKGLRRPNDPGNSLSVGPYGAEIAPPQVKPDPAVQA